MSSPPASVRLPAFRRGVAWGTVVVIVGVVMAYANSFHGPMFFDDVASLEKNPSIRQLWPLDQVLFAPAAAGTAGRPLLNFSFALNYAVGGLSPLGYHVVNLLIHLAAALTLGALVRRVLLLPQWEPRFRADAGWIAALAALLWGVHPLHTESVTYISQRAESLLGFFYLFTWYAFVRAAEPGAKRRWAVLSVAGCVAGVLTKEIMATAPVVIALFDRVFLSASWSELRRRRGLYLGYFGALILLGALMVGARLFTRGIGFGERIGWLDYALTECEAVALYLKLSVWPHPLVIDYGESPARGGWYLVVGALVVVVWLGAVAWAWRRHRPFAFAGLAALLMLAPTTSVVPVAFQPIAEHRMYLPLAMLLAAAVVAVYGAVGRRALAIGAVAVACGWAAATFLRNRDYASHEIMWRDAIAKRPDNWRAYNALANVLYGEQRLAEGLALVETALRLNAGEAKLFNNYANALVAVGRLPEGIAAGTRAVQLDPNYVDARSSLGQALLKAGRVPEAVAQFQTARDLRPESAEIRTNLCDALRQAGRAADAVTEGEAALRLRPDFAAAYCNLGLALVDAGRAEEAVAQYQTALRLQPDYPVVRNNLGVTLMNLGRLAEAQAQLTEALRRNPNHVDAHNSLGIVLAKLGHLDEAQREFETALRLQPGHGQAESNLQVLRSLRMTKP